MKIQKLRRKRKKNLILDMTPLIDVVFLLLIFFMVATSFKDVSSSINIELPSSTTSNKVEVKQIEIKINKELEVYLIVKDLNDKSTMTKVTNEELKSKLKETLEKSSSKNVVIAADKTVNYQALVGVLDIAKDSGATSLDLNTKNVN